MKVKVILSSGLPHVNNILLPGSTIKVPPAALTAVVPPWGVWLRPLSSLLVALHPAPCWGPGIVHNPWASR